MCSRVAPWRPAIEKLRDFPEAIAFVGRRAELAEAENHHPDIDIRYRQVAVHWSTHSSGGVTDRDRWLAAQTSALENLPPAEVRTVPLATQRER